MKKLLIAGAVAIRERLRQIDARLLHQSDDQFSFARAIRKWRANPSGKPLFPLLKLGRQ